MKQKEIILNYLTINNKALCDDCLSKILKIKPRQTVNQICNNLFKSGLIDRTYDECCTCFKRKLTNHLKPKQEELVWNNDINVEMKKNYIRLKPDDFERRVALYLRKIYNTNFREKALIVGENKKHKFDLVSDDNSFVVECKSYTWTRKNNFPSAKMSTAIETVFYLSRIQARKKVIVFQNSYNDKGESLVEVFVRRYDGILDDIEIWAYYVGDVLENDVVKIKREKKEVWYRRMYS